MLLLVIRPARPTLADVSLADLSFYPSPLLTAEAVVAAQLLDPFQKNPRDRGDGSGPVGENAP